MAKKLTPITVANAKPRDKRVEIPDGGCGGLYLVIQPNGHRSWAVRYRFKGKPRKLTLGTVDAVPLAEAHVKAKSALKQAGEGTEGPADEHLPESSVEILGHSVGGITYLHYAHRAPLAFKAIMTIPQPSAFSALIHGHDGECPCCRRPFADAG